MTMHQRRLVRFGLVCLIGAILVPSVRGDKATDRIIELLGTDRGICVVLGDDDGQAVIRVARKSNLLFYLQFSDALKVERVRRAAEAHGLDATRLQVDQGDMSRIHLADNLADVVVILDTANSPTQEEILRVLRPGGRTIGRGARLVKPLPAEMDDWSHPYHGPDNNPLSEDGLIEAPYVTQFLAEPRYGPAPQVAVASAGRAFKAFGHVAWHPREEALLNTLVAFNGFNGTMLWKRPLPEGLMVHRNTIIATPDVLYLGDDKSCKLIDTATGRILGEIIPPPDVAGGTFWKWMALEGEVLYALIGEAEQRDQTKRWNRLAHGWPWKGVSDGYNQPEHTWGFGRNLLAIDIKTKKVLWRHHEDEPIDSRAVCTSGGRIFAFRFGSYLTCLDAESGQVAWKKTKAAGDEVFDALGEYLPRQSWQTNWRTTAYLKCTDQALYFAGPQIGKLLAVAADDGRILWEDPYDNYQLIIHPRGLYGISGPWDNNFSKRFDPLTGEVLAEFDAGRRACTRPTATLDSILFRAMGGSIRFDLESGRPLWLSPMRPSCHDGVTVANGLLYWWPFACDCQLSLNGLTCVGPAGDFDFKIDDANSADRLEQGPDADEPVEAMEASAADWPTFRANSRATAVSQAVVPESATLLWQTKPSALPNVRPTAPVAVGGLVLLAGSDGVVRALDTNSGKEKWRAYTGGEIRIPPTIHQGRALVGSGDGLVQAFEATSGRLLWRFQAAPVNRKIPVYGKLLSTWPAASGVLVENQTAYVAAGLVNYDGTYVYALDPVSGKVKWCNDTSGHLDPLAHTGVSAQGHLLLNEGKLYMAGGNAVSPATYDIRDGACLNDAQALGACESTSPRGWELFLIGSRVIACGHPFYTNPQIPVYDHTVTKKILHSSSGATDVVWLDNSRLLAYEPLEQDVLDQCVTDERIPKHITQTWGEFKVSAKPLWRHDCPRSIAVAVSKNAVLVADTSQARALSLSTGKPFWSQPLPAAPVPWGMAIDRDGRVIVTLVDGQVVGIGNK